MNPTTEPTTEPPAEIATAPAVLCNRAVYSWTAHLRLWLVMVRGLVADLWSKHWAFERFETPYEVIPNALSFQLSLNHGALWGMGKGLTPLFIGASILAVIFVSYVFVKSDRSQASFHVALGMILAGALGNLYDRIFGNGSVRDFIKIELRIGDFEAWPWVFNVADMLLVCGVAILMLNIWLGPRRTRKSECEHTRRSA